MNFEDIDAEILVGKTFRLTNKTDWDNQANSNRCLTAFLLNPFKVTEVEFDRITEIEFEDPELNHQFQETYQNEYTHDFIFDTYDLETGLFGQVEAPVALQDPETLENKLKRLFARQDFFVTVMADAGGADDIGSWREFSEVIDRLIASADYDLEQKALLERQRKEQEEFTARQKAELDALKARFAQ